MTVDKNPQSNTRLPDRERTQAGAALTSRIERRSCHLVVTALVKMASELRKCSHALTFVRYRTTTRLPCRLCSARTMLRLT
jgi:hypothetical protein